MTPDELALYGQRQTADLHAALGADAEAEIKAATETFAKASRPPWTLQRSSRATARKLR